MPMSAVYCQSFCAVLRCPKD